MILNLRYALTIAGLLKIVSLVVGFIALVFGCIGCTRAQYTKRTIPEDIMTPDMCYSSNQSKYRLFYMKPYHNCLVDPLALIVVVGLVGAFWLLTLLELIVRLLMDIQSRVFQFVNLVVVMIMGVVLFLGGLVILTYALDIFANWDNCVRKSDKKDMNLRKVEIHCSVDEHEQFQPVPFLTAGILTMVTGGAYIGTGVIMIFTLVLRRNITVGPVVAM